MIDTTPTAARGTPRVGCSGWNYRDWRGTVYPSSLREREWFAHYAGRLGFDTVEINNTFYRLPSKTTMIGWAEQAPPGFVYAVKLGQFGSHRMKLSDAGSWLPNHLARVRLLGAALGPTLVQLPPRWHRNVERLDEFLDTAPTSMRWAVELRDPSWLHDDVFDTLRRHDAALVIHDLLEHHPWEMTASWTYLRFHGPDARNHPYLGPYTGRRLWRVADRLQGCLETGTDVYAYFNNDFHGHAVRDATWLRDRLQAAPAPSPAAAAPDPPVGSSPPR